MLLFCKDCTYRKDSTSVPTKSFCTAPKAIKYNLVTGDTIFDLCENQRQDSKIEDTCGRNAQWYFRVKY